MGIGIFVTGTDTGVGKTLVTAGLARHLRHHRCSIGVMKPIETGISPAAPMESDAYRLMAAAASQEEDHLVAPFRFEPPMAPLAAARRSARPIEMAEIVRCYRLMADHHEVTLVEGIGGVLVPVGSGWDVRDLIVELRLPVIVVGRTALGGVNHARLTVEALHARQIPILALVLNQTRQVHSAAEREQDSTTCSLLSELMPCPVLGPIPYLDRSASDWRHAVDEFARDPLVKALAGLICRVSP
jgi:dethiobiotin synthetase